MLQQGTEKSFFRVIFRIDFDIKTTMISRFNLFRIERFDSVLLWRATKKKNLLNVPARNREERYLSNWLWHYDCNDSAKYHFQIQLLSNCKFCKLSVLLWTATKRKSEECRSKEQRSQFSELPFEFALAL